MVGQSGFVDVLGVWAVGTPPTVYPEGVGRWIRKGRQLRTNLHYHPNGKAQTDKTRVGLYFGRGELKKEVASAVAGDIGFKNSGRREEPRDARALRDRPGHQHRVVLPAHAFPRQGHDADGDVARTAASRRCCSVPAYDFNWQLYYYPKDPVPLPRGTLIEAVAHYDNSAETRTIPIRRKT